jgi:lipoate-protein ligase A
METWRLILDGANSASFNMAADANLLDAAETGEIVPVIRLYGWDQPSITIGRHQKLERAIDLSRLGDTPVVRRITGGRALLHDGCEITYAVAANFVKHLGLGATLHESYRVIAEAIVRFYSRCGVKAQISHREDPLARARRAETQKGCFASVSRYEIIVGGRKAAAGSQRRMRRTFLQHGVIKIAPSQSHPAITDEAPAAIMLSEHGRAELERKVADSFAEVLGVRLSACPFSDRELAEIAKGAAGFGNLNCGDLSLNGQTG